VARSYHDPNQIKSFRSAKAVAAARDDTSNLKMFWRCRRTGVVAQMQVDGDRMVARSGDNQTQHLQFALRQSMPHVRSGVIGQQVDPRKLRLRPQLCEDVPGRLQLQRSRVIVPERAAGQCHQHTGTRCLVRRFEFLPGAPAVTQRAQGAPGIAFGQRQRSACVRRHGSKNVASLAACDFVELTTTAARLLDVVNSQHDLDESGQ
jgi:hypothetical protein